MSQPESPYPHLLSPLVLGPTTLRNRVVMGSMHMRLGSMDEATAREAAFYGARARGGVGLIVTGGFSPNAAGAMEPGAPVMCAPEHAEAQVPVVRAVHDGGAKFCLQILHAGRYAHHDRAVGASAIPSPINRREIRALADEEVERTIEDYADCAALARSAGFDGVEVMGSEGYLITQFCAGRTNDRTDRWGGPLENRLRFPTEIVRRVRARTGPDFLVIYRISALDLVEGGLDGAETATLAAAVEAAGADVLSSGIGWHEARVPTIAHMVPRAAWTFATARLRQAVSIPVVAANRINTPAVAENILAAGDADLVALARPLLADPDFAVKAAEGRADEINSCIACNQACLDHIFAGRVATCLVNPRAGRELDFDRAPPAIPKTVAVVGGGAAGMACAVAAAGRGHRVTLFEASDALGGQLNLAKAVPGKEEFHETLRYYARQLALGGVEVRLNRRPDAGELADGGFDRVVVATGVFPRRLDVDGADHPMVVGYAHLLSGAVAAGNRVAIVGAGGIGFDVATYLTGGPAEAPGAFLTDWGVDTAHESRGGLVPRPDPPAGPARRVTLLQRSPGRLGRGLGLTTGWAIRGELERHGVEMVGGATYRRIDDAGLHITVEGEDRLIAADTIVVCVGQEPERRLHDALAARGVASALIGGAQDTAGLDALRAIDQGLRLAYWL